MAKRQTMTKPASWIDKAWEEKDWDYKSEKSIADAKEYKRIREERKAKLKAESEQAQANLTAYWHQRNAIATERGKLTGEQYKQTILDEARTQVQRISTGSKTLEVPVRVPIAGQLCIIDHVNYVTSLSAYCDIDLVTKLETALIDKSGSTQKHVDKVVEQILSCISKQLVTIFGDKFKNITKNKSGLHGYTYQYTIGDEDFQFGKIAFGGNDNTVLIMVSGTGCTQASPYWEYELYNYLSETSKRHIARITRIDIALDDFSGEFSSAEQADQAETDGKFMLTHRRPKVFNLGDWKFHTGEGRTLQVGKRENGKMYRGYEKGKQLGDTDSLWFRSEIEFKNKDRHLPFEMLTNPTDYFAGAYPYCLELVQSKLVEIFDTVERLEIVKKQSDISFSKAVQVIKRQFGKYLKFLRELIPDLDDKPSDTIILDLLQTDKVKDYVPKRLRLTESFFKEMCKAEPSRQRQVSIPF